MAPRQQRVDINEIIELFQTRRKDFPRLTKTERESLIDVWNQTANVGITTVSIAQSLLAKVRALPVVPSPGVLRLDVNSCERQWDRYVLCSGSRLTLLEYTGVVNTALVEIAREPKSVPNAVDPGKVAPVSMEHEEGRPKRFPKRFMARGIVNLGQTCYLGATVHFARACRSFHDAVKTNPFRNQALEDIDMFDDHEARAFALAKSLRTAMVEVSDTALEPVRPVDLEKSLLQAMTNWRPNEQEDAAETWTALRGALHTATNAAQGVVDTFQYPADADVPSSALNNMLAVRKRQSNSRAENPFMGQHVIERTCTKCNARKPLTFGTFLTFDLPISLENSHWLRKTNKTLNLIDLLKQRHQSTLVDVRCDDCHVESEFAEQMFLTQLPDYLVFIIGRFANGHEGDKVAEKVEFPVQGLDMRRWTHPSGCVGPHCIYDCVAVHQSELCSLKLQLQKEHDILSTTALLEQQSRLSAQHHAAVTSLEEQNNSSIKALEERKHSELECLNTNMMDEKDRELAELGSKLDEEHEFKYGQLKSRMAREYSEKSLALQIELNAEKDAALEQQLQTASVEKDGLKLQFDEHRRLLRQEISDLTARLQRTSVEKDGLETALEDQRTDLCQEISDLTGRLQGILHEKDALNVALEDQSRNFGQEVEELMSSRKATIAELTERVHNTELKRDAFDRMVTELTSTTLPIFALSYHDLRYGVRPLGYPTILDGGSALIRIWKTWEDPQVHIQTKKHLYWLLYNFCWKVIKHANKPQNPLHQWLLFQIISAVVVYSPADEASDVLHQAMGSVVQMEGNDLSRLGLMGLHHLHETINARLQARRLAFSLHLTVPWDTAQECTWHIDCRDVQSGIAWLSSYTELEGHCHIVLRQKGTMSPVLIFHCNVAESGFLWFGASQYLVIIQQNHTDIWKIIVRQPGFREWSDNRIVDVSQALLSNLQERVAEAI